ncbi:thaumatin-like protein [Amylocystis lapponica]|nr:thaumatin-like protein [Amylocystis lapponica]
MRRFALALIIFAGRATARSVTVTNHCTYTLWYLKRTRWEAAPGSTVAFSVPDDWSSARIWGRRDCTFTGGSDACADGGCGSLVCSGIGQPPATLAEFTLGTNGSADFYDVSLVDGYNLPVSITNSANCSAASCPVDLAPNCPTPLQGPFDSTGAPVGCKSACEANIDGDPSNSTNCCTGSHGTPATCPPSSVQYYSYFKDSCPDAYAYAYDESSGTALWTCSSTLAADYTVTFCP